MFSKKKTECRVCGYRFTQERGNIYTAEEPRSMADMLTKAPTRFSAVDCPVCGCQIALAIRTTRGLVFIESRYLSPVADVLDVLELYERRTAEGTPYIVAKAGFLLQAVIMPYDVINQQFVESLQDLTRERRRSRALPVNGSYL